MRLEGPLSRELYRQIRIRDLLQYGSNHCFHFEIDSSGLMLVDERLETAGKGVRLSQKEEIALVAQQLMAQEPDRKDVLERALKELLLTYD